MRAFAQILSRRLRARALSRGGERVFRAFPACNARRSGRQTDDSPIFRAMRSRVRSNAQLDNLCKFQGPQKCSRSNLLVCASTRFFLLPRRPSINMLPRLHALAPRPLLTILSAALFSHCKNTQVARRLRLLPFHFCTLPAAPFAYNR